MFEVKFSDDRMNTLRLESEQASGFFVISARSLESAADKIPLKFLGSFRVVQRTTGISVVILKKPFGQVFREDDRCFAIDHGTFDRVFQLPDIAWPRESLENLKRFRSYAGHIAADPFSELHGEKVCDRPNVTRPFAQRWNRERNNFEPVIKIFSKSSRCYLRLEVAIARGD